MVLLLIYRGIFLFFQSKPNVVFTEFTCPETIWRGAENELILTNYGGMNSDYSIRIKTDGLGIFEDESNQFSNELWKKWLKEHNETTLELKHFIGESTSATIHFIVFPKEEFKDNVHFKIDYKYKTMGYFIPIPMNTPYIKVAECSCKLVSRDNYNCSNI